jgi:hypothetical protein
LPRNGRIEEGVRGADRGPNLAEAGPALDALANAITEVRVSGEVEQEFKAAQSA